MFAACAKDALAEWQECAYLICMRERAGPIFIARIGKQGDAMASITKEMRVNAPVERVWDAVRDVGAIHRRLVPGFVTDCRMDGDDVRVVTFGNGITVRELIVDLDDEKRRLVWSARGGRLARNLVLWAVLHNVRLRSATRRGQWFDDRN